MDLFVIKKVIGMLIMPINLIILGLIFAIIFYRRSPKFSFKCLVVSTILLTLSSLPFVSDFITHPIESRYEAFTKSPTPLDYIIILGCAHTTDEAMPAISQLKNCSLQRMVEGMRISLIHPEATIITSGFSSGDRETNAAKVKRSLIELGVPESKIITESFPKDTEEEAELISPRVIGKNVALVTNYDHMPRAIKYFESRGVYPIAAPASPWVKGYYDEKGWPYYTPSSKALQQTTRAWYETIGSLVQWFKQL